MAARFNGTTNMAYKLDTPPSIGSFTVCFFASISVDRNALSTLFTYWVSSNGPIAFVYIGLATDSTGTGLILADDLGDSAIVSVSPGDKFFAAVSCAGAATGDLKAYVAVGNDTALTTVSRTLYGVISEFPNFSFGENTFNEPFNGVIDNVVVYDSVLTADDVAAQRRSRLPIKPAYAWYPMNEPVGGTAANLRNDFSGNNRTLTLVGSTEPTIEASPLWLPPSRGMMTGVG